MAGQFLETLFTPAVHAAQARYFGREQRMPPQPDHDPLGADEAEFISRRDSFYLASVSESGWPYIQHRGGLPGFLAVVDAHTLAFADYRGNRQLLTTGNVSANDRLSLFLMDYPRRERLKILGRARVEDAREHPEWVDRFAGPEARRITERIFFVDVLSFDWNCPQHITPRYTEEEIRVAVDPLRARIADLEAKLATAHL
jgi:uncharacterized protein